MAKKIVETITLPLTGSSQQPKDFKASPEVINLIYADEISSRLSNLLKYFQQYMNITVPLGVTHDYPEMEVTDEPKTIYAPLYHAGKYWHKILVENTGSENMYFITNCDSSNIPLEPGITKKINPNKGVIQYIRIFTDKGKTTKCKIIGFY